MAEYTGEVIYEQAPQVKTKPKINPALANALVPQNAPVSMPVAPVAATPSVVLSPQDQRSFALSEANRIAMAKQKQAEEAAQEKNPTGAPTEGERTAATVLQRLQFSQQQLKVALAEDQTAAKPQLFL